MKIQSKTKMVEQKLNAVETRLLKNNDIKKAIEVLCKELNVNAENFIMKVTFNTDVSTTWHPSISLYIDLLNSNKTISKIVLKGAETRSGCGSYCLYGYSFYCNVYSKGLDNLMKLILDDVILKYLKDSGVGLIYTTLGQTHYKNGSNSSARLIENILEMKTLVEYNNYRHGLGYMQRLYELRL